MGVSASCLWGGSESRGNQNGSAAVTSPRSGIVFHSLGSRDHELANTVRILMLLAFQGLHLHLGKTSVVLHENGD
jgi:hypothetical protein